ncbi:MAG: hypothetical protein ACHP7N_11710, partial [Caulobacterales bacterium]
HSCLLVGLGGGGVVGLVRGLFLMAGGGGVILGWGGVGVGAVIAALATPHGLDGLIFPIKVMTMKTLPTIGEWRGPDFMKLEPVEIALLVGMFVVFWRGVRLSGVRAAMVLLLVHMTLQHVRQEVLLGVLAPLLIAEPLGQALGGPGPASAPWRPLSPQLWPQTALAAALFVGIIAARLAAPTVRIDGPTAPITALAHVPPALLSQPVLNDYDFGGYLIFKGVKPYIDGRADMYGDAFVANDDQIQRSSQTAMDEAISRYHIAWSIVSPDKALADALERTPGWRRVYADKYAVVDEKAGP